MRKDGDLCDLAPKEASTDDPRLERTQRGRAGADRRSFNRQCMTNTKCAIQQCI